MHLALVPLVAAIAFAGSSSASVPAQDAQSAVAQATGQPTPEQLQAAVIKFYGLLEGRYAMITSPTPEQIAQIQEEIAVAADKAIADLGVDFGKLGDDELAVLEPLIGMSRDGKAAYAAILDERAKAPTAAGFRAAVRARMLQQGDGPGALASLLGHPAFVEAVASEEGTMVLEFAADAPADAVKPHAAALESLAPKFSETAPMELLVASNGYLRLCAAALPKEKSDALRAKVVSEVEARLSKADGRDKKALERLVKTLNGAAARGELLGFPCPKLTFDWVVRADGSNPWKSVADLAGKVVVLDFWATWCGPCVGSFPQVAEMRKHYRPEDVEIVGVTSLQGMVAHQKRERVECKNDPEKERKETLLFMQDMGVTWTVGITAEEVFNPDFGIRGIPFVAVLDKEGKVFKAGLHPSDEAAIRAAVDECLAKK